MSTAWESSPCPSALRMSAEKYLVATRELSSGTCKEYRSTVTKWIAWGKGALPSTRLGDLNYGISSIGSMRKLPRDVGSNCRTDGEQGTGNFESHNVVGPGSRITSRSSLDSRNRKPQRDVAGRHYLTKADLNALYFATYELKRPRGWKQSLTVGHYWRAALVVFFNYGVDYADFQIMRSDQVSTFDNPARTGVLLHIISS